MIGESLLNHGDLPVSPLSGHESEYIFESIVLGKYKARYAYDRETGFIFVVDPHWIEEAYSSAIAITDTGLLARNISNVECVSRIIRSSQNSFTRGVDLGGGYGLFVRGMRDAGFEFFWSDKYSQNLVARGFEAIPGQYSTAVAFEVLEHLQDPISFLKENLKRFQFDTCFFSATCFSESKIPDEHWWYWAFETGQHVSFFSERALEWIASKIGMRLWRIDSEIYALSRFSWTPPTDMLAIKIVKWLKAKFPFRTCYRRHSLTFDDHNYLRNQLRERFDRKLAD